MKVCSQATLVVYGVLCKARKIHCSLGVCRGCKDEANDAADWPPPLTPESLKADQSQSCGGCGGNAVKAAALARTPEELERVIEDF